jgi:hypothetical protein
MPRRSKLRRRSSGWSDLHIEILKSGHDFFDEFPKPDREQAWNELRKEILDEWLQNHPGTRPFAWWAFDMPKGTRRQRIDDRHPHDDPRYDLPKDLHFGCPRCLRECDIGGRYESQEAYLRRLSLLTAAELKFLNGVN